MTSHRAWACGLRRRLTALSSQSAANLLPLSSSALRLQIRSSWAAWEDFRAAVEAAHPYEVPCIVGMPLEKGNAPFLEWIAQNSSPAGQPNE